MPRSRTGALLVVLLTGQAMATMDGSIVTVALPSVQRGLGTSGSTLQLIVSAYLLTVGVLIVTGARLGDLLGHRRAFLSGLAGFTGASLLCGLAPNAPALIASRVAQAAAAALLVPQVFSLMQLHLTGAALRRAIGWYSMVLALGVALGQILGGLIVGADLFGLSWRAVFLVNVPVGAVLLAVGPLALPAAPRSVRRLDLAGVGLLTVAMTAVIVPLILGRQHGWAPWTWLSLLAGLGLLAAFGRYERVVAGRGGAPLLDMDVLRPRGVRPGLLTCLLVMGCYSALLFSLTLHMQERLGFTPLSAGLSFVPYAGGFATLSLVWARLPERVHATLPVAGPGVFAAAVIAVAVLGVRGWTEPVLFVAGAGHAAGYSPLIARLSAIAGRERASAMSALNSTGPVLASVTAVAGLGTLYLGAGLAWTLAAIAALLLVAAAAAAVSARQTGRRADRGGDPEAPGRRLAEAGHRGRPGGARGHLDVAAEPHGDQGG